MKDIQRKIAYLKRRLIGMQGANIIIVNECDGETENQALKRYSKKNDFIEDGINIFIHCRSDEQIRNRVKSSNMI